VRCSLRTLFLLTVGITLVTACSINRENMYELASTIPIPDLVVLGYPNGTGVYDFGNVDVYTTDKATFMIQNKDRGQLIIYGISLLEDDAEEFIIETASLSSLLSQGALTTFTVRFKPTIDTDKEATVIIFSNCLEKNPYTFTLMGSGVGSPASTPDIYVSQGTTEIGISASVEFGYIQTGTSGSKLFTIENLDTGQLEIYDVSIEPGGDTEIGEFSIISPSIPASLAQNESTEFTVVFSPQDPIIKSATVSVSSDDPDENPYTFAVQGTGTAVPEPDIGVIQGEIDLPNNSGFYHFGFVKCGSTSPPVTFSVENTGSADLIITSITFSDGFPFPAQFTIDTSGTVFNLAPGLYTDFSIQFTPDLPEEYKWATVTIGNNDSDENSFTFTVKGEAVEDVVPDINIQEVLHNSEYDFGPVLLGDSKTETFTVENAGTADLNITSIVNNSPDKFTLDYSMTAFFLTPGSTTTFDVIFDSIDTKVKSAVIEINSNDPDEPSYKFKTVAYGSDGTEPDINIKLGASQYPDGSSYFFPDTDVGVESDPVPFTIRNNGTSDLMIESILLVWKHIGDFSFEYDEQQMTVPPGGSVPVMVYFLPTTAGKRESKLQIKSNDPDEEEYEIKLIGTGL
jgi:hypothetical protein